MDFVSDKDQNHHPHDWIEALPAVRSNNVPTLWFSTLRLLREPSRAQSHGGPQHLPSAHSAQAVGLNRTRKCDLQNLSLHRGPRLRGADGMEPDPLALLPRFIRYSGDAPRPVHSTCRAYSAEPDGCAEQEV